MTSRIALLIDAENISHRDLPRILDGVTRLGEVVLTAVYGNWQRPDLQTWHAIAEQNNFTIRQYTNSTNTKNASDMKLIMDAMDVLYYTKIEMFCLVTNDADYVPLCDKIHQSHKYVVGVGYPHAADAFIRACDQFIFIHHDHQEEDNPPLAVASPPTTTPQAFLRKAVKQAFSSATPQKDDWVDLSVLGNRLSQEQPGFQVGDYGYATLTQLLQAMPKLVEMRAEDTTRFARLRKATPKKASAAAADAPRNLLKQAFSRVQTGGNDWVNLSELGMLLRQVKPGFEVGDYGHSTLTQLLQTMPDLIEMRANGTVKSARLKRASGTHTPVLRNLLTQAFDCVQQSKSDWVNLSDLGKALRQVEPGFRPNAYGYATLTRLLQTMPDFVELRTQGSTKSARRKK